MITVDVKIVNNFTSVLQTIKDNTVKSLMHAGAVIRKAAQESMQPGRKGHPSAPGEPPHTITGRLKKSIIYASDGEEVLVGPAKRSRGFYGNIHEFGGTFEVPARRKKRKQQKIKMVTYPARPFMQPALENNLDRIPLSFRARLLNSD